MQRFDMFKKVFCNMYNFITSTHRNRVQKPPSLLYHRVIEMLNRGNLTFIIKCYATNIHSSNEINFIVYYTITQNIIYK